MFVLLLTVISNVATGATIEFTELPEVYPVSSGFRVFIDSVEIPVSEFIIYNEVQCHYAQVDFEGSVTIRVIANENIYQHQIRPLRHGIMPNIRDTLLEHELDKPEFLAYNINDKEILFLLARSPETNIPGSESDSVINIMNFGVDNTGGIDETTKIVEAINDAVETRKILYFPEGVYTVKQLEIKGVDGLDIYMAPGSVLRGTGKGSDFKDWHSGLEPGDRVIDHFIHIYKSKNISITGRGTIDPRGMDVHQDLNNGEPLYDAKQAKMKIRGITTESSQNIFIDGVLVRESSSQSAPFKGCNNIVVSNSITINYMHIKNTGGFNLWGCSNATVEDCFYYGGDDGLSAKAPEGYVCHHLSFENSVIYTLTRGITFGMQGDEDMHDVVFRNIDAVSTRDGIDFKHNYGKGKWYNILIENVTVDEIILDEKGVYGNPINLQIKQGGTIKDITFNNIIIQDHGTPGGIYGQHEPDNTPGNISNIYFNNIEVGGVSWIDLETSQLTLDQYADAKSIYFNGEAIDQTTTIDSDLLKSIELLKNYPNPLRLNTTFQYTLPNNCFVSLKVFDFLGKEVVTLVSAEKPKGTYEYIFSKGELPVGTYIYTLHAGKFIQSRKLIIE